MPFREMTQILYIERISPIASLIVLVASINRYSAWKYGKIDLLLRRKAFPCGHAFVDIGLVYSA